MRTVAPIMILLMMTSTLAGCADGAFCDKLVEIDNDAGEWDDAILYVAKRGAASTGHYEIVGLVKIIDGAKTFCAGVDCMNANVDSCVSFGLDGLGVDAEDQMLIGIAWDIYSDGDEIESSDLSISEIIDWGEWTSDNYASF